jgi:WD40 repeat protein
MFDSRKQRWTSNVRQNGKCVSAGEVSCGLKRFAHLPIVFCPLLLSSTDPKGKPFFSCASSGDLLLGASGPTLFVWDLRTPGKAWVESEEFHTEDINALAFHPLDDEQQTRTIFTGSEDGLICVLKPEPGSEPDDWLDNVINIENPVRRFGFFGPRASWLWALSCVETLSLWNVDTCERVSDFTNIRDALTRSANMAVDYLIDAHYDAPSQRLFLASGTNDGQLVLSHVNKSEIQPFCLAHAERKPEEQAAAAAASASAAAAAAANASAAAAAISAVTGFSLAPMAEESPFALKSLQLINGPGAEGSMEDTAATVEDDDEDEDPLRHGEVVHEGAASGARTAESDAAMEAAEAAARQTLDPTTQGHTATIRDVLWFDKALITGGEDSRLCLWTTQPGAAAAASAAAGSSSSSHKITQHAAKGSDLSTPSPPAPGPRHKPY